MRCINLAAIVALAAVGVGCSGTNVGVDARSPAVAAFQSHVGTVNTSKFELGDLVAVNPKTHETWRIASAQFAPSDVGITQSKDEAVEPLATPFDLTFDKKVNAPVENAVESTVTTGTTMHVENYFSRGFKNPAIFVAGSRDVSKAVRALHEKDPEAQCFLVSNVTSADRVYLKLESSQAGAIPAGKFTARVSYPQNEQLKQLAQTSPAFFTFTPLKWVEQDDQQVVLAE
jgi:hypothetical protein